MAFKRLKSGNSVTAALTTIYTVPSNSTASVSQFIMTNKSTNDIAVSVYVNDGTSDRLITAVTVPAGVGKTRYIYPAYGSYNGGDIIKISPASTDSFDYVISGREN